MIRQKLNYFGKPVEVWCNCVFEPEAVNQFCLASIYIYIQYLLTLLLVLKHVVNAYELQYLMSNEKQSMMVLLFIILLYPCYNKNHNGIVIITIYNYVLIHIIYSDYKIIINNYNYTTKKE